MKKVLLSAVFALGLMSFILPAESVEENDYCDTVVEVM